MTKILITGATGNVGVNVVNELRRREQQLIAFVRDPKKAKLKFGDGVQTATGDFSDRKSIRNALKGVSRLFLCCSNSPMQVEFENNVIDEAADSGIEFTVKLSASGAETGSELAFWDWQGKIEKHLNDSGLSGAILKPSNYMTNIFAAAETIKKTGMIFAPLGDAKISMIEPRDVADAAATVLTENVPQGKSYIITGPQALTYTEVAETLSEITGRKIEYVNVPDETAKDGMIKSGMPEWLAEQLIILSKKLREGIASETTETFKEITGREPRSFAEFARDYAGSFQT